METLNTTIATYLDLLNETDPDKRAELAEKVWAANGCWIDPPFEADGRNAIADMIGHVHQQYPGHTFRQASGVDTHHDLFRFAWELVAPDGKIAFNGMDVGQVGDDGRFVRVTGFLGDLPALAA